MKTINTLILAGALTLGVSLANSAKAEAFLSPRAQANKIAVTSGGTRDANRVSGNYAGAALKAQSLANPVVSSAEKQPNLVSGNYPGAAGKNPALAPQFQIAPAVTK